MKTFEILGFTFGLIIFVMVNKLTQEVKNLQRQIEAVNERLPTA